jgi:hypothetical protein
MATLRQADLLRLLAPTPRPPRTGLAYVGVRIVVYALALVAITLLYSTKERALFIAPPIGILAGAVVWYLLGDTSIDSRRRLILSVGAGVIVAELTWALGYWSTRPLIGSAVLWLGVYVLSGVIEAGANDNLERRVGLEYGLVAAVGGVVLVLSSWITGS